MSSATSGLIATIVQAGAGTGKTQSLAEKIISLAKIIHRQKGDTPRFVATTFTERATSELRERVVSLLAKEKDVPKWLFDFVQDTENLHISTIHGTLSLFLYRYGSLLGLDPEFTILKSSEEREFISLIIRKLISADESYGILLDHYSFGEMVDLSRRLMPHHHLHGEKLAVAVGWEDIFKSELSLLLEALSSLEAVDVKTLTAKAGETFEVLQKLSIHLKKSADDLVFCHDLFLEAIDGLRKPTGNKAKEFADPLAIIFDTIRENWRKDKYSTELNQRHEQIAPLFQKLVVAAAGQLANDKKDRGLMSFNDLEFLAQELVVKHPEVLKSWRQQWDFWFIDEFQDTSPLQRDILFSFFRDPWNAYFVGDPQQSIYLFRGADENVFQQTKELIAARGGSVERLAKNFRSHPDLMSFLNLIFTRMKNPVDTLQPYDKLEGTIRATIHTCAKEISEEEIVVAQIQNWVRAGVSFQDMAVLVRKNSKARLIGQKLGQFGVPVYVHSSGGFYDRREILDALGLLTFLEDPSDDQSFTIIARAPWIAIPDIELAQWGIARGKLTFWDWLTQNEVEIEKHPNLKILKQAVFDAESLPLSQVFSKILDDLGFWEFCLVGDSSGRREANLRKFVWSLRRAEEGPQYSAVKFIEEAWQEILDVGEETEAATFIEPERVNIMTVHKSKGLKFKYLIVPYCGDAFKAMQSAMELSPDGKWAMRVLKMESEEKVGPLLHGKLYDERSARELAESMRVFYVAITRAAEEIVLVTKSELGPTSWLGQVDINLSKGEHEGVYNVKEWKDAPVLEKIKTEDNLVRLESALKLVHPPTKTKSRELTVTQVIENQNVTRFRSIQEQMDSQQRGQAIHFIFEQIRKSSHNSLTELCKAAEMRFMLTEQIAPQQIKKTLAMTTLPLSELLKLGQAEWPFVFRNQENFIRGQIDLWGTLDDQSWIVDYKSYKKFSDENLDTALKQLEIYALAINKNGVPWEKIKIAVVAPFQAEARILELPPREDIERRLVSAAATAAKSENAR